MRLQADIINKTQIRRTQRRRQRRLTPNGVSRRRWPISALPISDLLLLLFTGVTHAN